MGMDIGEILSKIERNEWVLPPFQRNFVWSNKQKLLDFADSLYEGYPIGSIVIWKPHEDEVKERALDTETGGKPRYATEYIMDGQQRLTTISRFFNGESFTFTKYPYTLHYDFKNRKFRFVKESNTKKDCIRFDRIIEKDSDKVVEELSDNLTESTEDLSSILGVISDIKKIKEREPPIEREEMTTQEAMELFIRVNTGGKQLKSSNLALGYISVKWEDARDSFNEFKEELNGNFDFGFKFFMRCLWAVSMEQSITTRRVRNSEPSDVENIEKDWERTKEGIEHLVDFLKTELMLDSNKYLKAENTLIPIVVLFSERFEETNQKQQLLAKWLLLSYINQRFSGQSTSILDDDIETVLESEKPVESLLSDENLGRNIVRELEPGYIEGESKHLKFILNVLARRNLTRDPISGHRINSIAMSDDNEPNFDHIFSKDFLGDEYESSMKNDIANLTLMEALPNKQKSNTSPEEFLPEIDEESRKGHFIPVNEELYKKENFPEFLEERRRMICDAVNSLLSDLES